MIKGVGTLGGQPLLIIGLSAENVRRLMADQPILFDTAELDAGPAAVQLPRLKVLICGGATEDSISADLRQTFVHSMVEEDKA